MTLSEALSLSISHALNIDLNNDNLDDFTLTVLAFRASHIGTDISCSVTPLNNNSVAQYKFDSCFSFVPPFSFTTKILTAFSFSLNDTINENAFWTNSATYMSYVSSGYFAQYYCSGSTFNSNGYLGLRVINASDTLYGWLNLQAFSSSNQDSLALKEFACNTGINGVKSNTNILSVSLNPNPCTEYFIFKINGTPNFNHLVFETYDVFGRTILSKRINSNITSISTSQIPSGLYFYALYENQHIAAKGKIIVR